MRYLLEHHPVLFATGVYLWFIYGAATTIWGNAAEREYEWRENSMFRWFLRPRWPLDDLDRFVSSRKVVAWVFLLASTFFYVAFLSGKLGGQALVSR